MPNTLSVRPEHSSSIIFFGVVNIPNQLILGHIKAEHSFRKSEHLSFIVLFGVKCRGRYIIYTIYSFTLSYFSSFLSSHFFGLTSPSKSTESNEFELLVLVYLFLDQAALTSWRLPSPTSLFTGADTNDFSLLDLLFFSKQSGKPFVFCKYPRLPCIDQRLVSPAT